MPPIPRTFFRTCSILPCILFLLVTTTWFIRDNDNHIALSHQHTLQNDERKPTIQPPLNLNEKQCRETFPSLFTFIDTSLLHGPFPFRKSDPDYTGLVQGRIKDGKLYILTTSPTTLPQTLHQRTAILSQLHRALITSPSTLPDSYFAFCTNDVPKNNTWSFTRPNNAAAAASAYNVWLMPSFASWSWPNAHLGGPMDAVLERIADVEERQMRWEEKIDRVVWRGTVWFNPLGNGELRKDLLRVTRGGKGEWADVEALTVGGGGGGQNETTTTNRIDIEDFCRYKYIVYTEGVTYSGRLPFHQACASVLIMAPATWLTSTALLLKPIRAEDLMRSVTSPDSKLPTSLSTSPSPSPPTPQPILHPITTWRDANAIYVNSDFSNLEAVVRFLRQHPDVAQRIARNQRETVVGGGYLSMAAETCYWRGLIRAWAAVAEVDKESWGTEMGERYETWLLKEVSKEREGRREAG